jgi:hypothetical protein
MNDVGYIGEEGEPVMASHAHEIDPGPLQTRQSPRHVTTLQRATQINPKKNSMKGVNELDKSHVLGLDETELSLFRRVVQLSENNNWVRNIFLRPYRPGTPQSHLIK